jgi:hypothetical protein
LQEAFLYLKTCSQAITKIFLIKGYTDHFPWAWPLGSYLIITAECIICHVNRTSQNQIKTNQIENKSKFNLSRWGSKLHSFLCAL